MKKENRSIQQSNDNNFREKEVEPTASERLSWETPKLVKFDIDMTESGGPPGGLDAMLST
ncbi:MAG: hypothetical protein PVH88_14560 [Ignavibacteria bacterium]|jgi:hypothetical protein